MRGDLAITAVTVTVSITILMVLFRLSETTTPSSQRQVEQMVELADQYYEDARASTHDIERFRLKAMTMSLLKLASLSLRADILENITGYSVARRIKHIEQDLTRLRQSIVPLSVKD